MCIRFLNFVCSVKKYLAVFFVLIVFGVCDTLSSDFEPGGKPEVKIINPDAEVVIGSILNIRERGSGSFSCGEIRPDAVIKANALKWMIDELNKKIWSGQSANVSLGLYIMDSCGRTRTATSQLIEFLPELQSTKKSNGRHPFKFCLVDDIGLKNETDIYKSLEEINFPIVETDVNINSAKKLMEVIFLFLQELRWERFAIVHSNSKFSTSMLRHFTKSFKKFDFCIPWLINSDRMNEEELKTVFDFQVPIVSLLPSEEHFRFLKTLRSVSEPDKKIPIFFSDFVSRRHLKLIPVDSVRVFSVTLQPESENGFENYYSNNWLTSERRRDDELSLIERTKTVRKIKRIGEKISEVLKNAIESYCYVDQKLCQSLMTPDGRDFISESLEEVNWADEEQSYQLVEYRFEFFDVHLHKIMTYNGHKSLAIFENNVSFSEINCEGEQKFNLECRCLEIKDRMESARNIDDWDRKKHRYSKNHLGTEKKFVESQVQDVSQFVHEPMIYANLNDPVNAILACLTLLGGLVTLIIAQYFATFAALPNGGLTTGTSIIGYVILIGLFLLYSTNCSFLLTPLPSTCTVRRFAVNFSYTMVFSGMLIKVWSSLRLINSDKAKCSKPFTLLAYSAVFTGFQGITSGLWLALRPPATDFKDGKWICYPPDGLDYHLILSMIYPLMILLTTIILAIRTCSKSNNDEARWILISSSLVAIILCCWGVAVGTGVWQGHRTACTNLATSTILLICLYIPKIRKHSKLKKTMKVQTNSPPLSVDIGKECSVFTTSPAFPVVFGYNVVAPAPIITDERLDSSYMNHAYSVDESSETTSTPFDVDSSSYSELEQEPYKFSTFLEDPQPLKLVQDDILNDPTQMIPSALYPLDMFNIEPIAITSDHCQPGTNEFTPPHRTTSQLYLCPQPEWVP